MTRARRVIAAPPVIHRYLVVCEDCKHGRVQAFYSEDSRDRFAREHAMSHLHRLTLSEETLPCRT